MKSKYSGIEIEKKLDSIPQKIDVYNVIDNCPITLQPEFKKENIFNANVIVKLFQQVKNYTLQSPSSFLEFVDRIPGYHLLTDEQADKLRKMSSNFVGVFADVNNIPNIFKNGSLALIQSGPFAQPEFIFRSKKRWYFLTGSKIFHEAISSDKLMIGHNVIKPYKMAKITLYATNDNNTHTIEFNVIKSKKNWWIQIFKSTLLENENELVDISLNRSQFLSVYPEIVIEALDNCELSINLEVIL